MYIPYCPGQVPMGARSSIAKIEGGRLHGEGATLPKQGPTPDAKVAAMGPNRLASQFVHASSWSAQQWRRLYHARYAALEYDVVNSTLHDRVSGKVLLRVELAALLDI